MSSAGLEREDDRSKKGSGGLGIAAAAAVVGVGIGVGAALYYFFKPQEQAPHTSNSREAERATNFRQRTLTLEACSICTEVMLSDEELWMLPGCGHKFHVKCVTPWIEMRNNCPNCRKVV